MGGRNEPTIINGVKWVPTWEDSDVSPEVRLAKSKSDTFNQVEPVVAAAAMVVTLEKIRCRENASVVQQPSAENDFTTIVEFDDSRTGGADWYELKLTFTPAGEVRGCASFFFTAKARRTRRRKKATAETPRTPR
jgi:hypothetical protein